MASEFTYAGQPELMRSTQKDDQYIYLVYNKLLDILERLHPEILHYKDLNKYKLEIKTISILIYYMSQTYNGQKTLGEEYANTRQFNQNDYDFSGVPVIKKRAIQFILLNSIVSYLIEKLKPLYQQKLVEGGKASFMKQLPDYDVLKAKIMKLHLAYFFIHGQYFEISKRLTTIKQIFTRTAPTHNINYKTIGRILMIQMIIEFVQFVRLLFQHQRKSKELEDQSVIPTSATVNCSLCFDVATNISCTPCGHIFCWDCVITYVSQKQQCPQCRSDCPPNKVVRLINFN